MFSLDQYKAARGSAALVDRSSQGKLSLTGADRASFLHALLTNDIAGLTAGKGCYAAYLTPQGRMITDMRVVETGDRILLDVEGSVAAALAERLDKLIFSEDVHVQNVTGELAELGMHGPGAVAVLARVTATAAGTFDALNQYDNLRIQESQVSGAELVVVRDDSLGVPGFDIYAPSETSAARLTAALLDAGAVECSEETAEALRIETGRPRFGVDMDTDTIPLEAGIEGRAISFTKGCYVGQEVIVRVMHRGHGRVARRLVGLLLPDSRTPSAGAPVISGEQEVGRITSASPSPRMNAALALGYVQRDYAVEGTDVLVKSGGEMLHARVHQFRN